MTGEMTTVRSGLEHRPPRLSQHPTKTDEIEVLESAGGDDQQDKVYRLYIHLHYIKYSKNRIYHYCNN